MSGSTKRSPVFRLLRRGIARRASDAVWPAAVRLAAPIHDPRCLDASFEFAGQRSQLEGLDARGQFEHTLHLALDQSGRGDRIGVTLDRHEHAQQKARSCST